MRKLGLLFALSLAIWSGCNYFKKEDEPAKPAPNAGANVPPSRSEASPALPAPAARKDEEIALNVAGDSARASRCSARLIRLGAGRPSVLQLTSYDDPARETFPSVMLQANVSADSPAALADQEVEAKLYIQTKNEGPVWESSPAEPVRIQIVTASDEGLHCKLVGGKLIDAATGQTTDATGSIQGVYR